ncbi:MAG TPA: cupin domain-containing protein [Dehalococcoidia bacterium]|nr:cupin domain-containing protein [Dehalococcoidia bacterium]
MERVNLTKKRKFSPEKMTKVGLFETDRMFCDIYCFEPGQTQKAHAHEGSDKVYLVLEGSGEFSVGGETATLGPGEAVLAPSGADHGVTNTGSGRLVLYVFMAPKP